MTVNSVRLDNSMPLVVDLECPIASYLVRS
jgi:hypothetical protein